MIEWKRTTRVEILSKVKASPYSVNEVLDIAESIIDEKKSEIEDLKSRLLRTTDVPRHKEVWVYRRIDGTIGAVDAPCIGGVRYVLPDGS